METTAKERDTADIWKYLSDVGAELELHKAQLRALQHNDAINSEVLKVQQSINFDMARRLRFYELESGK